MENKLPSIFRIPQISTTKVSSSLIGLLDASGSMSSYWKLAAQSWNTISANHPNAHVITFSSIAKERTLPLTDRIYDYDCSSTNIIAGFEVLNQVMSKQEIGDNVTIIFISDGQDDNSQTLPQRIIQLSEKLQHRNKKINFISIGVGSGFPTFVAMNLREIYHNGESSLPPVFLIDQPINDNVWKENFEMLEGYTQHSAKLNIKGDNVKVLPWQDECSQQVYENSWVISNSDRITVNDTVEVEKMESLTPNEIISIAKGWLSELQITSLKKNAKDYAVESLRILNGWKSLYIDSKQDTTKLTFNQRILKKQQNTISHNIQVIFKEIKNIAEDVILSQLSDVEAAKRLAIGTQTGKYHNAALQLKGITVSDFISARDYFLQVYKETSFQNESDQEVSVISLQNQKDVFRENDLCEGLRNCPTQYDLVECFPIVGHAIQVKRSDGAMINPYMIRVKSMSKHHKIVDTVSLLQGTNNELAMKIGDDEEEVINCVIPLFSKKDEDMKPLIRTKLFHILMTFNVMGNADTCFENAYLALLANVCVFLLNETESEWRKDMLDLVANTLQMTYADNKGYIKYAEQLIENPRIAVVTEHPDIATKCEDLSKPILVLFYLCYTKQVTDPKQIESILHAIYAEAYGRNYPSEAPVSNYFEITLPEHAVLPDFMDEQNKILSEFPEVSTFYTKYEMKNELSERINKLDLKIGFDITAKFLDNACDFMKQSKFGLDSLNKIFSYFLPEVQPPNSSLLMSWTLHASKFRNSYERNTTEINLDTVSILEHMRKEKEQSIIKNNKILENTNEILTNKFEQFMCEKHFYVEPMDEKGLIEYCTKNGIARESYEFNQVSNLLKNACMAPACPHFMKPTKSLAQHLESYITKCPAFHKAIKMHITLTAEEILEKVTTGECLIKFNDTDPVSMITQITKDKLITNRESYIATINRLKEFYQKV